MYLNIILQFFTYFFEMTFFGLVKLLYLGFFNEPFQLPLVNTKTWTRLKESQDLEL